MSAGAVVHNTFVIERSYSQSVERVFAAFADPALKRRWFGEGDHHDINAFSMEFRIGGKERLQYTFRAGTPFPGVVVSSDVEYLDIVPNQRVITGGTMVLGGNTISAAMVTVELVAEGQGTKLLCTHQAAFFEGSDGPQIREMGWRALFEKLAKALGS